MLTQALLEHDIVASHGMSTAQSPAVNKERNTHVRKLRTNKECAKRNREAIQRVCKYPLSHVTTNKWKEADHFLIGLMEFFLILS